MSRKIIMRIINAAIALVVLVIAFGSIRIVTDDTMQKNYEVKIRAAAPPVSQDEKNMDRKIDFEALWSINPDVIGWIYIPGSKVDYPIMCSSENEEEDFYLRRDINKEYKSYGSIYIQKRNSVNFIDEATVVYGHNMRNGSMLTAAKKYLDQEYMANHQWAYIYLPSETICYKMYDAVKRDDSHVLSSLESAERRLLVLSTCDDKEGRVVALGEEYIRKLS